MVAFILLAVITIALVLREVFDTKKKKIEEELKSRTMPSGLILPKNSSELLAYKKADLIKWDKDDIRFFLNYIMHRRNDSASEEEYEGWNDLFYEASRALYDY